MRGGHPQGRIKMRAAVSHLLGRWRKAEVGRRFIIAANGDPAIE